MIEQSDQYKIICASKYYTTDEMIQIYNQGYHDFGENKVYDMLKKMEDLKDYDITWHFIGHLQTNKVKEMINQIDMLHTLDRNSLRDAIQKYANHKIDCLIQVNIGEETQKSGILLENLDEFLLEIKNYDKINVVGFMTMGIANDPIKTEEIFKKLYDLKTKYQYPYLSMGMSDDYELAIKHHATHLRIGRFFKSIL
ncbi:MAG: YggS family pyridoxal phosphate-dependent enzyme [Acholeplasmataceae bacterium]